jgi:hypothetical protein
MLPHNIATITEDRLSRVTAGTLIVKCSGDEVFMISCLAGSLGFGYVCHVLVGYVNTIAVLTFAVNNCNQSLHFKPSLRL